MLAILASFAIVGAGVAAVLAVVGTLRGQMGAIRQLLADARAMEQADALDLDRLFLERMVESESTTLPRSFPATRRAPGRFVRGQTLRPVTPGPVTPGSRRAAA